MAGGILLEGGGEFRGQMAASDRRALAAAGGPDAPVAIVPAAAAPDHNAERAGRTAVRWFRQLGAARVAALPLVDQGSADDAAVVTALNEARLIFLLGGFPGHLAHCLAGSRSWQAILSAHRAGAVIAGSSAGAMVLGSVYRDPYDPAGPTVKPGLALIGHTGVIPHHETLGPRWLPLLRRSHPALALLGIDEETGALAQDSSDRWQVLGKGRVTRYGKRSITVFESGDDFTLVEAPG
jgi:cyanophycinase